jgi:ectoine hydroxylase-related dioxygenase (phytanoyl-CoA dioxygenase family)
VTIYNTIQNKSGFCTLNFNIDEKNTIKNFVTKKFESNLKKYKLPKIKIENYHKLKISDILHKKIFTRENRTVSKHFINFIKKTSVFNKISKEFNFIKFSKKVIYNKFDVFWRIVRPLKNDVGDIHADEWFWSVNNWKVPKGYECLKFWIMLSDNLNYGLSIIPGSHKINFPYKKIFKDKIYKPQLVKKINFKEKKLITKFGTCIIFNYKLLHRGLMNKSTTSRVSIEFTLLCKNKL